MAEQTSTKQTLGFQTEVKQLLHLMVHALYSNKEIFLRELISNASDAADKLRYEALAAPGLYENDSKLTIYVEIDKEARTLTIRDNGIGMSRDEVINHLGTIAKSGTKEFLAALSKDQAKDANMIGQFGVGFYSAFIVADKVTVITRRAGMIAEEGVRWESTGEGEYTIEMVTKAERGTEVILHLKKEDDEFLESWRIRSIITKYSDHITLPIMMQKLENSNATEEENKEPEKKAAVPEWEQVNRATALWTLPKSKIKDEEYKELYKHIAHDFEDPLCWSHNKVEGNLTYTSLLYVPSHAPFDLFNRERPRGVKLYVKRVFIMDEAEQFLPLYLRFIKGVVDSDDLPLNISREILQDNKTINTMRSALIKRVLDMLEKLAADDKEAYGKFWREFGKVLKEGPAEDFANREKIAALLRFASTHRDSEDQTISLNDYINRMQPGQDKIYYITAENFAAAKNSPNLEIFRAKNIEVLLLTDRIDEWLVNHLSEFNGKKLQSVAQGNLDLGELEDDKTKEKQEKTKQEFQTITERVQKVLADKVKEVRVTQRLTASPACVVTGEYDMNFHVQQLLKSAGQAVPDVKPILELNPEHTFVRRLKEEVDEDRFADWANVLLDQAILADGGQLNDPANFVQRLNNLLLELAR